MLITSAFPITMIVNLDPMFSIVAQLLHNWNPIIKFTIRLVFNLWACLVVTQSIITCFTCSLSFVAASETVLARIIKQKLSWSSIRLYIRMQLISNIGHDVIKFLAAFYLTLGFFLALVVNYILINCFNLVPILIYLCAFMIATVLYLCLNFLLPQVVYCTEVSTHLIKHLWYWDQIRIRKIFTRFQSVMMRKVLRAQRPIKYYYGNTAFDQDTKRNYYWKILEYTINLSLLT